jgi:sugar/nucleoside kinase (ribokinase family)
MELVGIGNALMDVVAFVDESFAPSLGFHNNSVSHIDRGRMDEVLGALTDPVVSAGGGAANVARASSILGARAAYAGCVGEDKLGEDFLADLAASEVEALVSRSGSPTGVYCALIRPEGGRTLLVSQSAALDLTLEPPMPSIFRPGATLFIECFLLRERSFFMDCLRSARESGMEIAIDLSSRELASSNRDFILGLLPTFCDVLFANEDEFAALTRLPIREGLELFSAWSIEVVVKRAEMGALWSSAGAVFDSPVRELWPVDATGAGDAFAAGFLYGRSMGLPPERSLRLGNRVAEEVLGVPGLGVDPERVKRAMNRVMG